MSIVPYLVIISLCLGAVGLVVFLWSLKNGQYEDLDGAAERVLFDDESAPEDRRAAPRR
ncbi:MAG: cbb3-type cytochrome oxidase assembly protein CcoS [Kiloniellaceae bacterium]